MVDIVRRLLRLALGATLFVCCAGLGSAGFGSAVRADEPRRLLVLHRSSASVPETLRSEIDRSLLHVVTHQAGFASAYASPVPAEEVELAAGCTARDVDCLQRIAASLEAEWLMVRELAMDGAGHVYLTLIAHDGPDALVTRRAVAQVGTERTEEIVALLVDRLYPGVQQAERSVARAREQGAGPSALSAVGWTATGITGGLLLTGAAVGLLSRRDQQNYAELDVSRQRSRVDRAHELHGRAQRRAKVANGLFVASASMGVVAAAALLWSHLAPRSDESALNIDLTPAYAGVSLRGAFRGGI